MVPLEVSRVQWLFSVLVVARVRSSSARPSARPEFGPRLATSASFHRQTVRQAPFIEPQPLLHRGLAERLPVCGIGEGALVPAYGLAKIAGFGIGRGQCSQAARAAPARGI